MKEPVSKFNMEAAFKALEEIDVPKVSGGIVPNRIDLKESMRVVPQTDVLFEEYYDLNSAEDVDTAKEEREAEVAKAKLARIEKIVDLDAETEDDILPSYVGKMIVQCPQCMTLFYKNPEDIEYSEENPDVVNINEVCQHCGNTSGYTLVGKVDKVGEDEADKYDTDEVEDILDAKAEANDEEQPAEEPAQEEAPAEENTEELPELPELPAEEEEEKEETNESLNNSELLKDAEKNSELATENKSENLTLNEDLPAEEITTDDVADAQAEIEAEEEVADNETATDETTEKVLDALNDMDESINNSELLKDAEKNSELATENKSENLTLNEGVTVEVDLADVYEPWQGAVDTWNKIVEADAVEAFEDYLKDSFPDGNDLTLTKINDILWFDGDQVLEYLGLAEGEEVDEGLTEASKAEGQLDDLLDSPEFKKPISDEEVSKYLEALNRMSEACENGKGEEKPLEECDKQPLQEAEEDKAAEENAAEDAPEAQEEVEVAEVEETPAEEETAEDEANTETEEQPTEDATFTAEEVKDIAEDVAEQAAEETVSIENDIPAEEVKLDGEIQDRVADLADEAVDNAVEAKADEETEEVAEETVKEEQPEEAEEEANDDEEVVALLGEIDDASIEECLNKSLQEVYSNVENFKLASKAINEQKDLVVEGTINFKSGKQKATRYIFNECVCDETPDAVIIELKGVNNDLADDGVFVLNCKGCKDAPMMAESFSYNYHIGETLVEGLIK